MSNRTLLAVAALAGGLAVILGALGAHALEAVVDPDAIESFNTGVRYQMWHCLGLLALLALGKELPLRLAVAWLWILGMLLFSGSIYLLSLQAWHGWPVSFLGPVTPLGGLLLIGGWLLLFVAALRYPKKN